MITLNNYRLRILREVAARGTYAAAAEALYLTGPAVSHQIATLERELGVPLFMHNKRALRLTEAGRRLVRHSDRILADCEAAVADVQSVASEISGTVRISIIETAGQVVARPAIQLRKRHPDLDIVLVSMRPFRSLPALRAGELDIVISNDWDCMPATASVDMSRFDLLTESYFVALPPSHPLASQSGPLQLKDLAHESWCVTQEEVFRTALTRTMHAAGFQPHVVFESIYSRSIAGYAEIGLGIGVIPASTDVRGMDIILRPLAEPALTRHVFALIRSGSEWSPGVRTVLEAMSEGAELAVESGRASSPSSPQDDAEPPDEDAAGRTPTH
jgi:DNA-binding transcriptional LysR family regulator